MSNEDYIKNKAIIYERYKDQFGELTEKQIDDFRNEVSQGYSDLLLSTQGGLGEFDLRVDFVHGQPYENVQELTTDIESNRIMRISQDHNDSKLLPGKLNLKFRAIHDYLHYVLQAPFTATGEIRVYHLQNKLHPSEISKQILFSEVVLQACYAEYFKKFAPIQKVVLYKGKI